MDSSKTYGDAEECHSSESGWTMYIGSPINGEDDDDDDDPNHNVADGDLDEDDEGNNITDPAGDDSDDSMASDASSGPSHQIPSDGSVQKEKNCSNCKAEISVKKNRHENQNEVQEGSSFKARGAKGPVQNVNKVRKNHWIGSRK